MDKKISVVINTYNAEKDLARVLESVKGFDEIVICDMESTDSTLNIAKKYDCKIVSFPKANHKSAEPARTFAIQSATYPWVLVVDADELVTSELKEYLYNRISEPDCPAGLYIPRKNYFMGKLYDYPDFQLRFFIKEGTTWPPYVHTFPMVKGILGHLPKNRKELAFIHLANDTISLRLKKTDLYTDNEVEKRHNKHYNSFDLVFSPLWRTIRRYFFKGGIRMGKAGFINAVLEGFYKFVTIAKIIERERDYDIR